MKKVCSFSGSRFLLLLRKEVLENWKSFLLRMLVVYGILAIILVWQASFLYSYLGIYSDAEAFDDMQHRLHQFSMQLFMVGMFVFGIVSASRMMEGMNTKARRISILMLPATMLEKFLSRMLLYAVISLLAYVLAFMLADFTRSIIYWVAYLPDLPRVGLLPVSDYLVDSETISGFFRTQYDCMLVIMLFLFSQSLFALGSCIWPRLALQKTFAFSMLVFVMALLFGGTLTSLFLDGRHLSFGSSWELSDSTAPYFVMYILLALGILFNWVLAYCRFKESEIIHRW